MPRLHPSIKHMAPFVLLLLSTKTGPRFEIQSKRLQSSTQFSVPTCLLTFLNILNLLHAASAKLPKINATTPKTIPTIPPNDSLCSPLGGAPSGWDTFGAPLPPSKPVLNPLSSNSPKLCRSTSIHTGSFDSVLFPEAQ